MITVHATILKIYQYTYGLCIYLYSKMLVMQQISLLQYDPQLANFSIVHDFDICEFCQAGHDHLSKSVFEGESKYIKGILKHKSKTN